MLKIMTTYLAGALWVSKKVYQGYVGRFWSSNSCSKMVSVLFTFFFLCAPVAFVVIEVPLHAWILSDSFSSRYFDFLWEFSPKSSLSVLEQLKVDCNATYNLLSFML